MNTIVVTGGLGFIGSNLIKILNKKDYYIINIDKINYSSNFQNISSNIKNDLDWKCKTNFDSGIIKTIKWYLDNFENNFFKNKQFSKRMGLDT